MKLEKAAVIGAGAMGSGIAQVLSQAGIEVVLKDVKEEFVERGLKNIRRMYDSRVKKEALTKEEADRLFAKIKGTTSFDDIDKRMCSYFWLLLAFILFQKNSKSELNRIVR